MKNSPSNIFLFNSLAVAGLETTKDTSCALISGLILLHGIFHSAKTIDYSPKLVTSTLYVFSHYREQN